MLSQSQRHQLMLSVGGTPIQYGLYDQKSYSGLRHKSALRGSVPESAEAQQTHSTNKTFDEMEEIGLLSWEPA